MSDRLDTLMQELYQEAREKNAAYLAASLAGNRKAADALNIELVNLNAMLERMEAFQQKHKAAQ